MSVTIAIASLKGGVGKTTLAAGIAKELAQKGKKVCLADCKKGGTLDMAIGCEDDAIFCLDDVTPKCQLEKILIQVNSLDLCSAPSNNEGKNERIDLLLDMTEEYDYVILDDPTDFSRCDKVIIVTTPSPDSVRCAEMLGAELRMMNKETGLIVNCLPIYEGIKSEVSGIIDRTYSPLVGALPFMWGYSEKEKTLLYGGIFNNVCSRLMGDSVPLFEGLKNKKRMQGLVR